MAGSDGPKRAKARGKDAGLPAAPEGGPPAATVDDNELLRHLVAMSRDLPLVRASAERSLRAMLQALTHTRDAGSISHEALVAILERNGVLALGGLVQPPDGQGEA